MEKLTREDVENEKIFRIGGGLQDISLGVYPMIRKYSDYVRVSGEKDILYSDTMPIIELPSYDDVMVKNESTSCSGVLMDVKLPDKFEIMSYNDGVKSNHLLLTLTKEEIDNLYEQLTKFIVNGGA